MAIKTEYEVILWLAPNQEPELPYSDNTNVRTLGYDYWNAIDNGLNPRVEIRRIQVYEEEE